MCICWRPRDSLVGSERFKGEIERALAGAVHPPKRGRPTRSVMLQGKPFG
jgi:hypothetical protein